MGAVSKIAEYVDKGSGLSTTHSTAATLTPVAGLLYLALVPCQGGSTTDVAPTLTGAGMTWTNVGHITAGSVSLPRRVDLFAAVGVAGVGGSLTVTYSTGRRHIGVFVDEWADVDTTQGTLGVLQVVGAWDGGTQSGIASCSLATFSDPLNYAYLGVATNSDPPPPSERSLPPIQMATGWTGVGQRGDGQRRAATGYHRGPSPGPSATFPTDNWLILGAEVAAEPSVDIHPGEGGIYAGPYKNEGWQLVLTKNDGTVLATLDDAEDVSLTVRLNGHAELHCRVPMTNTLDLDTSSRAIKAYRNGALVFYGRIAEPLLDEGNESGDWTQIVAADPLYWLQTRMVHNAGNAKTITYHENSGMIAKAIIDVANAGTDVWPDTSLYSTTPPPTVNTFVRTSPNFIQTGLPLTPTTDDEVTTVLGRVYIAVVSNRVNALDTTPSLTGPITWTLKNSYLSAAYGIRTSVFWGVGTGAQGAVTANFGTGDADGVSIIVDEFLGVDTLSPIVQIASAAGDQNSPNDGAPQVTLAAFADATHNATYAGVYDYGRRQNNDPQDGNWVELGSMRSGTQLANSATEYRPGAETNPVFGAHKVRWQAVGLELRWDGGANAISGKNKVQQFFGIDTTLQYDVEQLRPISEVIHELAGMHNGFYYRIVPVDGKPTAHGDFYAYYPDPGVDRARARFEYGARTLANLSGFRREARYPRQEGYVAQDNNAPTVGSELAAGADQGEYGYQEVVVSPPNWLDKSLYPDFVLSQTDSSTSYVYTVAPTSDAPVAWDDFAIGDVVRLTIQRGRVQDIDVSVLVTEYTVTIDNDTGQETLTDLVLAGLHDSIA